MGLLAGGRGPLGEKILAPIQTGGWGTGISNKSPETSSPLDKRGSYPLVVDQRLDPGTLWSPHHDNDSRISVRSLQDDQDYSRRMLRVSLEVNLARVWRLLTGSYADCESRCLNSLDRSILVFTG